MTLIATPRSHPSMESENVREKSAGCIIIIITPHSNVRIQKYVLHTSRSRIAAGAPSELFPTATPARYVIQSKVKVVYRGTHATLDVMIIYLFELSHY